ncbi:MAG: hypothetical protein QGG36_17990 [Pirellulaceae bacterium]|jgi:hypothetical protein|nr:hypothetical protein [Pirellulaceae bacterium]
MNPQTDDRWESWLTRRRNEPTPDVADRVMERLEDRGPTAVPAAGCQAPDDSTWAPVLLCAAALFIGAIPYLGLAVFLAG